MKWTLLRDALAAKSTWFNGSLLMLVGAKFTSGCDQWINEPLPGKARLPLPTVAFPATQVRHPQPGSLCQDRFDKYSLACLGWGRVGLRDKLSFCRNRDLRCTDQSSSYSKGAPRFTGNISAEKHRGIRIAADDRDDHMMIT